MLRILGIALETKRSKLRVAMSLAASLRGAFLVVPLIVGLATPAWPNSTPLSVLIEAEALPPGIMSLGDGPVPFTDKLEVTRIMVKQAAVDMPDGTRRSVGTRISVDLVVRETFEIAIPHLDQVLDFVVTGSDEPFRVTITRLNEQLGLAESQQLGMEPRQSMVVRLEGKLPVGIRLNRELFRPMVLEESGTYTPAPLLVEGVVLSLAESELSVAYEYTWDGDSDIRIEAPGGGEFPGITIGGGAFMVAGTGVIIDVTKFVLDLSERTSPPGPAGSPVLPPEWTGVRFEQLSFAFQNEMQLPTTTASLAAGESPSVDNEGMADVTLTDFWIGPGGFSGGIQGTGLGIATSLGGLRFDVDAVGLVFEQSGLKESAIAGTIREFPFFNEDLKVDLAIDLEGDFKIAIAEDDENRADGGLASWTIDDVMTLDISTLALEKQGDLLLAEINGELAPDFFGAPIRIPIDGLRIASNGEVALRGGWLTLPQKKSVDFNGFKVELWQFGLGSDADRHWVGFSGGIELVGGLSAAAKFRRLRALWPISGDGDVDLELEGIEVAYSQPGVMNFRGSVDWDHENDVFAGALTANMEFIKTSVGGRLVIGKKPFDYFYIDLDASLPTGVPVFADVSLYGLSGLLAVNLEPNLGDFRTPLVWFTAHQAHGAAAVEPRPWRPRQDAIAAGLGVILGTTHDDGYLINAKTVLTVALPGPIVMFSGMGNILESRGELVGETDPPFAAIAVYDRNQNAFLINLGVRYRFPSSGTLIDVAANTEAYFNLSDPSDFHLWVGRDTPESERVRAEVLRFLSANAYYMLDPTKLKFGAKAGLDSRPKWKYGPLRVQLGAWIAYDMALSWRPVNAWGKGELGGHAKLRTFGRGVGLSVNAALEMSTPNPYLVAGRFRVKINLPWPLPDPKATVKLRWEDDKDPETIADLLGEVELQDTKSPSETVALKAPGDGPTIGDHAPAVTDAWPVVEVTTRPVVAFTEDVNEAFGSGADPSVIKTLGHVGFYSELVGKEKDTDENTGRHIQFSYNLSEMRLWAKKTRPDLLELDPTWAEFPELYGAWAAEPGGLDATGGAQGAALKLSLFGKNPFSIYKASNYVFPQGGELVSWPEWYVGTFNNYPCPPGGIVYDLETGQPKKGKCDDFEIVNEEDLVLPPYHAFCVETAADARVRRGQSAFQKQREYRRVSFFRTEGVPLNLTPFVYNTTPASEERLHYRWYDVGVRFNETYMDLLYKRADTFWTPYFHHPQQKLYIEILSETGRPVAGKVITNWAHALDHVQDRTEWAWRKVLEEQGLITGVSAKDDAVFGWTQLVDVLDPQQRYTVQVWFRDPRLATDERFDESGEVEGTEVLAFDGTDDVLLYEFAVVTSAYKLFSDLGSTYDGFWFKRRVVREDFDSDAINNVVATAFLRATPPEQTLTPGHSDYLGRALSLVAPSVDASSLTPEQFEDILVRLPGYPRGALPSASERAAIHEVWSDELSAFDRLEEMFFGPGVIPNEPLPLQVELSVVQAASEAPDSNRCFLLELPEPIDWSRTDLALHWRFNDSWGWDKTHAAAVVNRTGTRAFIFDASAGELDVGAYRITLTYRHENGARQPILRAPHPDNALARVTGTEQIEIVAKLPHGYFKAETD